MLAALHVLGALGGQEDRSPLPVADHDRYARLRRDQLRRRRPGRPPRRRSRRSLRRTARGTTIDELDGLTVTATDWWFNLRPSNTEPS